ncbi:MAG: hypothetical protein NC432_07630 [Roseburia sp.]|nr:hypothetical protein [Roseburia sp.]MCM1099053.1 hypothetical protein [Ruminococcus flavefaciens]
MNITGTQAAYNAYGQMIGRQARRLSASQGAQVRQTENMAGETSNTASLSEKPGGAASQTGRPGLAVGAQRSDKSVGSSGFDQEAAVLELADRTEAEKQEAAQKASDAWLEQYLAALNSEEARQQKEAMEETTSEYIKIMTVAMRISRGDIVPYTDEKKLLEASPELYQAAKSAQMMHQMDEKHRKHKSLWKDEKDGAEAMKETEAGKGQELSEGFGRAEAGRGQTLDGGFERTETGQDAGVGGGMAEAE